MRWKLVLLLLSLALPGVIAASWLALPLLVDPGATAVPLKTLQVAAAVQGALLVLTAAVLGLVLGRHAGVSAPALSAIVEKEPVLDALRPQVLPGFLGGVAGAGIIVAFHAFAPEPLAAVQGRGSLPLMVRILYGGITEEVLARWGLMTLLLYAGWRVFQRGSGKPSVAVAWTAIAVSALLFGISHVPSVAGALAVVPASVIAYVAIGNAMFGLVAGYLFWRHGLEAAITAHVLGHVFADVVRG